MKETPFATSHETRSDNSSTVSEVNPEETKEGVEAPFDEMVFKPFGRGTSKAFTLPIVEEGPPTSPLEKEWLSLAGRIEILLLEDQDDDGNVVNQRLQIVCLPSDSVNVASLLHNQHDDSILQNEGMETPITSLFEQLASNFLESCTAGPCETVIPKSVLRKDGEERNVSRSVTFDNIEIREFNMTLGDHPSAVTGPPMALDWEKESRVSSVSLDEYEASREPRRHRKQLKMSMKTRCGILQKEGNFTANEITQAWEEALQVRKQRRETLKGGVYEMVVTDFKESLERKLERFSSGVSSMLLL